MSTKATRATLQIVLDRLEDNLAEEGLSRAQRESYEHQLELARESLAEVEQVERVAKAYASHAPFHTMDVDDVLRSIAKDAP